MKIKIFTAVFEPHTKTFNDDALQKFIALNNVIEIKPYFFQNQNNPLWTIAVTYKSDKKAVMAVEQNNKKKKPNYQDLSDEEKKLFDKLKVWRNEKAKVEGIAPYIIIHNSQLIELVKKKPAALTQIKDIRGLGENKVKKYGQEILEVLHGNK